MDKFLIKKIFRNIVIINIIFFYLFTFAGCSKLNSGNVNSNESISQSDADAAAEKKQDFGTTESSSISGSLNTKDADGTGAGSGKDNTNINNNNDNGSTQNQDNGSSDTATTASQTTQSTINNTPPRLSLEVIEGPVILEDNSICYYRIKAKANGSPSPEISFSKDDSGGAWGKNIAQINLLPGETYELAVKATNLSGQANASVNLAWEGSSINKGSTIIVADEANPGNYLIEVSLNEQKVKVFYKNELLKEMVCSSGAPVSPTPKGTFRTSDKIKYAWLPEYNVGAYYFVRFYGSYLFHSTPFDKKGNLIEAEQQNLGKPVSHGCVRLDLNDEKWLYDTLPSGVTVKIY